MKIRYGTIQYDTKRYDTIREGIEDVPVSGMPRGAGSRRSRLFYPATQRVALAGSLKGPFHDPLKVLLKVSHVYTYMSL